MPVVTEFAEVEADECNMRQNFKDAIAARNNFMTEEEEATWKERAEDPWVVTDIKLELEETEKQLFDLMLNTLDNNSIQKITKNQFRANTIEELPMRDNVRLRTVGGWLRDKLLIQEGWERSKYPLTMDEDIDIVIETDHYSNTKVTARDFALLVAKQSILNDPTNTLEPDSPEFKTKVEKMVTVPEMRSQFYDVDFATLRIEGMDDDYRLDFQSMPFKTKVDVKQYPGMFETFKAKHLPVHELYLWKDSCCRDLTINALHYNIGNGFIEDILGNGIQDLKNGILRTPDP